MLKSSSWDVVLPPMLIGRVILCSEVAGTYDQGPENFTGEPLNDWFMGASLQKPGIVKQF